VRWGAAEDQGGIRAGGGAPPVRGLALGPVAGVAAATVALLAAVAPRYGWHRDELYFREAGRHLDWGFVDQPPFAPFVARLADLVAPDNLVALRTLPALATALSVVLGALLVRELGGDRWAQTAGAAAVATGGFVLGAGHLLSTATFDLTAWMAMLWLTARLLRTADPRWWLAFGAVAGASMLNKNLMVLLGTALVCGLVAERRWDLLWSVWTVAGAALALLIASPNLAWQAANGWPQVEMARVLSERIGTENRVTLLPMQVLFLGPPLVVLLWRGARWLLREPDAVPFRPLLWAWPAGLVVALVTGGRPYYVLPLTTMVALAGLLPVTSATGRRRVVALVVANGAMTVPLALPVLPLSVTSITATVNEAAAETVGWPELVDQVAGVVATLPEHEQATVVLLTASYGEAGAIDRFGPDHELPPAHSPHNGYADFRRPTDEEATVVAIRFGMHRLEPHFERCEPVGTVDLGLGIDNEVQGTPITVCRGLRAPWPQTWEAMRFLS
jgi:4-amino-4-deoxy-L-arabinose transferase-like glycosyltransferase